MERSSPKKGSFVVPGHAKTYQEIPGHAPNIPIW